MNQFPPSPRVFHKDRFEFFWKFMEIFASQGAHLVSMTLVANLSTISASIVDTGGKFATGVKDTGCHQYQQHWRQMCHQSKRHRWQTMGTKSNCWQLKMNLKKLSICWLYYPKVSKINHKNFSDWRFFPPVANLELRVSQRIFKKIWNGPNGKIRGLGETDSRKKPEAKNLVTLSL